MRRPYATDTQRAEIGRPHREREREPRDTIATPTPTDMPEHDDVSDGSPTPLQDPDVTPPPVDLFELLPRNDPTRLILQQLWAHVDSSANRGFGRHMESRAQIAPVAKIAGDAEEAATSVAAMAGRLVARVRLLWFVGALVTAALSAAAYRVYDAGQRSVEGKYRILDLEMRLQRAESAGRATPP